MQKTVKLLIFLVLTSSIAFSQAKYDKINELYEQKELLQAAELIPNALKSDFENIDLVILSGDVYFELERYKNALEMYQKADDMDGGEPPILKRLGQAYCMLGNKEEGCKYLKRALAKVDDEDPEIQAIYKLALAKAYIKQDSISQAEILITQVRDEVDDNAEAYITLGDLYFAQRVYALAKDNYEEALELEPNNVDARRKLAISYYWLANREYDQELANELFTRSLKEWNEITKQEPKDAKAWYEQGRILFFSERYPDAAKSLYEYVQLRPQGDLGRWYLAQSLYEVGACDSAAPHLEIVANNIDSVKTKARLYLARCYVQNEDFAKAAQAYEKLKAEEELDLADERRLGQAYLFSNDTTKAIEIWTNAVESNPEDAGNCQLSYLLGQLLTSKKIHMNATKIFEYWLNNPSCEPSDEQLSKVNYFIGYNFVFAEKLDSTINYNDSASYYLNKAIAIDSNNYFARLYLGDIYAAQEKFNEAIDTFKYITENADTTENAQVITQSFAKISGLYLDNKDWQGLLNITKKWNESLGDNEYAWLYRAIGYQGSQNLKMACNSYQQVLKINPKNETASKNYQSLKCAEQNK